MVSHLYPLLFEPVLKSYLWGGRKLESRLGRQLPPEEIIAESWEVAAHNDGDCMVRNGYYAGHTLSQLQAELGTKLCGTANAWALERGKFPLLVKLLDATEALSVQVHPDDAYALAKEGNELGKTEMWVVLQADPGARLVLGVRKGVDAGSFRQALTEDRLEDCLNYLPVQSGDHVCVPAGTLHAILGGLLIAEIQQNSNTTYRVYDWGRVGADGRERPLHIDKALAVIDFSCVEPAVCPAATLPLPAGAAAQGIKAELLCRNRYFVTERLQLPAGAVWEGCCDGTSLEIWGVLEGSMAIYTGEAAEADTILEAVGFCLLPAALGRYRIRAETGATLLRTRVEA